MSFNTQERRRVSVTPKGKSLTEQAHAKSCDIHNIMKRYEKTGIIDHVSKHSAEYGNFPTGLDFHNCMNVIAEANSMFESLPAEIRADHENDPARFLDWIQDEGNRDEITKAGFSTEHLPPLPDPVAAPTTEGGQAASGDAPASGEAAPQGTPDPAPQV